MNRALRLLTGRLLHVSAEKSSLSHLDACRVASVGYIGCSRTERASAPLPLHHPVPSRSYSTPKEKQRSAKIAVDDASQIPLERIRNFSIIAHIDHGKSTLSDRLIESCTNRTVKQAQLLDTLDVERERGITVKANSASFVYNHDGKNYLMNLVDTPGHVDFSYEVSRALAACQGACLLVDAAQGIQAQTLANFYLAFDLDLAIVPVLNKVDLPAADPERTAADVHAAFDLAPELCVRASAKTGVGIEEVLKAVVERIPPPQGDPEAPFRLLLFDAKSDEFRGVICMVLVKDGCVRKGDRFKSMSTGDQYDVLELGVMAPEMRQADCLKTGQVGYIITGLKSTKAVRVGDTWHHSKATNVTALPGFKPAKAMMFAGIYPMSQEGFEKLADAMDKLTLNDASVTMRKESSVALGPGFRCGFLGMLHMDVFMQRLMDEHGSEVLTTAPMVPYRLHTRGGKQVDLESPLDFPKESRQGLEGVEEPTVDCTILVPEGNTGAVLQLCSSRRGDLLV